MIVLKLECIGDDAVCRDRKLPAVLRTANRKPWVARLGGLDAQYGFVRTFEKSWKDYSEANSIGSRGVYACFDLNPGFYEVQELLSWKRTVRYYIYVWTHGDEVQRVSKEDVIKWLRQQATENAE